MKLAPWSIPTIPQLAALRRILEHGPMTRAEMRDLVHGQTRKALDAYRMIDLFEHPRLGGIWDITKRGRRALEMAEA